MGLNQKDFEKEQDKNLPFHINMIRRISFDRKLTQHQVASLVQMLMLVSPMGLLKMRHLF
jgi:hypothetical protein